LCDGRAWPNHGTAVVPGTAIRNRKWKSASERTKDSTEDVVHWKRKSASERTRDSADVRPSNVPLWPEDQTCTTIEPMKPIFIVADNSNINNISV
jgi:hypothetical protein